jgi:hypothetical protein
VRRDRFPRRGGDFAHRSGRFKEAGRLSSTDRQIGGTCVGATRGPELQDKAALCGLGRGGMSIPKRKPTQREKKPAQAAASHRRYSEELEDEPFAWSSSR